MHVELIRNLSKTYLDPKFGGIVSEVIDDPRFALWSGSAKASHHHYGNGGLARHTYEVIKLCFSTVEQLHIKTIIPAEMFLAALYHDVGKIHDYEFVNGVWQGAEHKRLIHHISRSAIVWSHAAERYDLEKYHDDVLHDILSHHGQRSWGSPVSPKRQAAWMLHLCDNLSARMDDWDRLDVVHGG